MNRFFNFERSIPVQPLKRYCNLLLLLLSFITNNAIAQCTDWGIKATLVASSLCTASGSFTVSTYGPDAVNLTNLQYGIPIAANGFSVPLNNSSGFSGIPPGTYTVSTVATCGGNLVGKSTTITIPGNYNPPKLMAYALRSTLTCGNYGKMQAYLEDGAGPFTINITSKPIAYTGTLSFTTANGVIIDNLAAGTYTLQAVDACGSGTTPVNVTIGTVSANAIPLNNLNQETYTCDTIQIYKPTIVTNIPGWGGYAADTLFKISAQISGGLFGPTPYEILNYSPFKQKIPPGKTLKDYYGKTITYTIVPPCGSNVTSTQTIPYPNVQVSVVQNCNTDFLTYLYFIGDICYPISYKLKNIITGNTYGPYTATSASVTTPSLPIGSYSISYTTADGYIGSSSVSTSPIVGNPYSVSIAQSGSGLDNYIDGFLFTSSASLGTKTVELFNGPSGYSFSGVWGTSAVFGASGNQTPGTGTLKFKAGYYVWKITDNCGSYYLPITVTAADMYHFTVGVSSQQLTCAGLKVWPSGSAALNGTPTPVTFSLLKDGLPYVLPPTNTWPQYAAGSSIMITEPGNYTLVPSATNVTLFLSGIGYPNPYTPSYSFSYNILPVKADANKTQGFICIGAATGQGKIFAMGIDGMPYHAGGTHYNYYLAASGKGASGPYIASNTTGIFTGFGGNANVIYDVKIQDSCGAFAVQPIKILDLQHTRLISSSNYVACEHDTVRLQALYLPGATYSWTGPAGFSSSLRNPVIANITTTNIGVYRVTITTTECPQTITDTTLITMAGNPPKPIVSLSCLPPPVTLTVTNPTASYFYQWDTRLNFTGYTYDIIMPTDTNYSLEVYYPGRYRAMVTDTTTGCTSYSDSAYFGTYPGSPFIASIYSPHLKICSGDTTILVAKGALQAKYQWFKDGVAIPGATNVSYTTAVAGKYKVYIDAGSCSRDTTAEVTVSVITTPTASITVPKTDFCIGDVVTIQGNTGTGYTYTWYKNGITIPSANSSDLGADASGNYFMIVSNGGCIATSNHVNLTSHPKPILSLNPNTDQALCIGDTVRFSTPFDASYNYSWYLNGNPLTGITSNTYDTRTPGSYIVKAYTTYCPNEASNAVSITLLLSTIELGNDTTICDTGAFAISLSVSAGFDNILWSDGSTGDHVSANTRSAWWVTATNKCATVSDTIHILRPADYLPNLPDDTLICNEVTRGRLFVPAILRDIKWNTGTTSYSLLVTQPGVYWVQGESICGTVRDTVKVDFCVPVVDELLSSADSVCEGDCIQFRAVTSNYPQKYLWNFEGGSPISDTNALPSKVCYAKPGVYDVMLTVTNVGGSNTKHSTAYVLPKPIPAFRDTAFIARYKSMLTLPACVDAERILWYMNDSLVCDGCKTLNTEARLWHAIYKCVVSNGNCTDYCTYKVTTTDIPSDIWMPSAFSPNGDGLNDYFRIITDNPNIVIAELSVFNRFGQKIYSGGADSKGWDGKFKDEPVDVGTYFWQIKYHVNGHDDAYYLKGDITIVK